MLTERMPRLVGLIVSIAGVLLIHSSAVLGQNVEIPDKILETVVRSALGSPTGTITSQDMLSLTELDNNPFDDQGGGIPEDEYLPNPDKQISSLAGLQSATNLQELFLGGNAVSDLAPLSGLTSLQGVNLYCNRLSDISPLSNLHQASWLVLSRNSISDLSPLTGLKSLYAVDVGQNPIADISPLASLPNLEELELNRTGIADISALSGLNNLRGLNLNGNRVTDISAVANDNWIDHLDLSCNDISDISPLANMTNLKVLALTGNPLNQQAYDLYLPMILANNPGMSLYYDPLPEPSCTMFLLGGLAAFLRRKGK